MNQPFAGELEFPAFTKKPTSAKLAPTVKVPASSATAPPCKAASTFWLAAIATTIGI
jgi:hypothetical protein